MTPYPALCAAAVAAVLAACGPRNQAPEAAAPTVDARTFVANVNREFRELQKERDVTEWVQSTYITQDTTWLRALANDRYLARFGEVVEASKAYDGQTLDAPTARALKLLRLDESSPAPTDPVRRTELTTLLAKLDGTYGANKGCREQGGKTVCRTVEDLDEILASSRDYTALTDAWSDWHATARSMRADYVRFVELANEGARDLGFADLGTLWRSKYDMPADELPKELDRLWSQVKPLYDALHCYTRAQLAKKYGEDRVPAGRPIPAQLLGNLWAQQWGRLYPDLLQPFPKVPSPTIDGELKRQGYEAVRMTRLAEDFYTSLGFPKLPQSFWERSMLTRPRDREVVCHASASHLDGAEDVRIKQCVVPTEEDLQTLYHEMGHLYYDLAYKDQPMLFQGSAHDGFHEAIGDTVVLSMTPSYLKQVGLRASTSNSREAMLNDQMRLAADRVAFLPFGLLVDQWRWKVFSGEVKSDRYNAAWWELRERYQGVGAPIGRSEADFDAGAKYHVPANVPYTRYFLAFILQFQFHKALCETAGFKGPLHECSIYGSTEAGQRFRAMLSAGNSEPWQDTLQKLTGSREMDASAIVEYFQPLMAYLQERNAGQKCGWSGSL
ncbi:MAG: M2 family metallopeptidase [Steroidobacteraceae bacterium]